MGELLVWAVFKGKVCSKRFSGTFVVALNSPVPCPLPRGPCLSSCHSAVWCQSYSFPLSLQHCVSPACPDVLGYKPRGPSQRPGVCPCAQNGAQQCQHRFRALMSLIWAMSQGKGDVVQISVSLVSVSLKAKVHSVCSCW